MALIKLNMNSKTLGGFTEVYVFCPFDLNRPGTKQDDVPENGFPVLYLNHGGANDYTQWLLNSDIYRVAERKGLFIVLPTVEDQLAARPWRGDYLKFVAEELPEYLDWLFPISKKREDTSIAGLSYGGYFAYRVAMNYPEKYGYVGSFSSPIDVMRDVKYLHDGDYMYSRWDTIPGSDMDIMGMASKLVKEGVSLPKMYQACGTEDFTWKLNTAARDHFRQLGCDHTWEQGPGTHNFDFWNQYGPRFIEWMGLPDIKIERPPFTSEQIGD